MIRHGLSGCFAICAWLALLPQDRAWAQACAGANAVPGTQLCLAGTTVVGNGGMAIFKAGSRTQSAELGDEVGGWRITAIKADSVTIQRGAASRQLALNDLSKGAAPHSPAVRPTQHLHDVSPVAAGKAKSVGTSGPGPHLSISTHLPPVEDY